MLEKARLRQDVQGLARLMSSDHQFIDRAGEVTKGKDTMIKGRTDFFRSYQEYRNTFHRVQSQGYLVVLYGYGIWEKLGDPDYAISTVTILNDQVAEMLICEDTEENRVRFNLS